MKDSLLQVELDLIRQQNRDLTKDNALLSQNLEHTRQLLEEKTSKES